MPTDTSAHSVITLWRATGLLPDHNYVIEDILSFLGEGITIQPFQFLELKPKMTIKIQQGQQFLEFNGDYNIDYCHIARSGYGFDDLGAYYFVVDKRWKSKDCLELELEMDVLNSFEWDTHYTVSDKTLVKRQHKNRFSDVTTWSYMSDPLAVTNETITMRIQTPLMANARIKSVSNAMITIIEGDFTADLNVKLNYTNSNNSGYVIATITSSGIQKIKFSFTYQVYAYMAYIDLKSEGINPPLYKVNETQIQDPSGVTWSLLYKNKDNNDNVIDCFLYPSSPVHVHTKGTGETVLNSTNVPSDKLMIFAGAYNDPKPSFTFGDQTITPNAGNSTGYNYATSGLAFKSENGEVRVYVCTYGTTSMPGHGSQNYGQWTDRGTFSSISVSTSLSSLHYYASATLPDRTRWYSIQYPIYGQETVDFGATITIVLKDKTNINKTDPKNIKLINLPYCPTQSRIVDGYLDISGEWYQNGGVLQLKDLNIPFRDQISTTLSNPIHEMVLNTYNVVLDGTKDRSSKDPKLYHSDFYYKKFVYDSFSKIFRCECLDWNESMRKSKNNPYFYFDFITSRNIVSKFLFMFPQYTTGNRGIEDYDNILTVARNNEEVLYNSQYLNYLKTGYNYDLKTKERNTAAGAAGIGLSLATLVGSIALTATGVGASIGAAGIIGSVAGLAGSAISLAKTTAQAEENIQRKLQESQNQAVSVSNADDYDLLEAYSGNMAKMCTYEVSTQMKNALDDMFYYAGYVVNEQYKPDVNIRYWFDFLQADLVISHTENLSKEVLELIKKKFSEGVTFFHCHTLNGARKWDLAQEKENWEKWIVLANGGAQ